MKINSVKSISEAVKVRRNGRYVQCRCMFFSELENGKETLQMNKVLHCLEMLGINLYVLNREDSFGELDAECLFPR